MGRLQHRALSGVIIALACVAIVAVVAHSLSARSATPLIRVPLEVVSAPRSTPLHRPGYSAAYLRHSRDVVALSYAELLRLHAPPFVARHGLDVQRAEFYRRFVRAFGLSPRARQLLDLNGFVVVPSPARQQARRAGKHLTAAGPADVYYRVFAAKLPVFVSADSILHAWHRSFDALVAAAEGAYLRHDLNEVLRRTIGALDCKTRARCDARLYLTIAEGLLTGTWRVAARSWPTARRIHAAVSSFSPKTVPWLGRRVRIDFSRFKPRGHYAKSLALRRYFVAMSWLGQVPLALWDPARRAVPFAREEAAARSLVAAMDPDTLSAYSRLDRFYGALFGRRNAVAPGDLLALCARSGAPDCRIGSSPAALYRQHLASSPYASRLSSRDRARVVFNMLPQRASIDSWIFSRTTTPVLEPAIRASRGGRSMASPLDVAFALGADRAATHLASEMRRPHRQQLPATLEALRRTVGEMRAKGALSRTIFDRWLGALVELSASRTSERLPRVMRTAAWHDRKLEAVIASWAELRHDSVLAVAQSAGGIGCQYPKGYVDPLPELYGELERAALATQRVLSRLRRTPRAARYELPSQASFLQPAPASAAAFAQMPEFLRRFVATMRTLAQIARVELAGRPMSARALAFLNRTVDEHAVGYGGVRRYDGWYPALFWTRWWGRSVGLLGEAKMPPFVAAGLSKPIAADVHTDTDRGRALQLGVGHPSLVVVAIDAGGSTALYGGPAYSLYSFEVALPQRLTDAAWRRRLDDPRASIQRPAFVRGYRELPARPR